MTGSLAVHNVVQLSDAEVRDRFVVRGRQLAELLVHLREGDPPRHALVIGSRGMGKSLLLRRVAVNVAEDAALASRWLPVLMPEELYQVGSVGELWLAALGQLAAVLRDDELAAQHRALLGEPDPTFLEAMALQRLLAAARSRGRKVLLLAENLDMVLGQQVGSTDAWALRQVLQTEPDLLLIGSAVTTFAQMDDPNEAFHQFFHRIDLRPLDDADVRSLWRAVTGVDLPDGRAAAVRILTGGNPRLATVLGRFSRHPDLSDLRGDLDLLIDEYTPFFKANIEALPPAERKVFATLADIWAPATAAEVAERTRMTSSQVSALLLRLVRRGAVDIVDHEAGRHRYELTERLYNLYHLLRRPDGEGRVRALVDILTHLYGPDELERDVWPGLVDPSGGGEPCFVDTMIASRLERHIVDAGVFERLTPRELLARLSVLETLLAAQRDQLGPDHRDTLLTRQNIAYFLGRSGDRPSALRHYREVLADQERVLGPDDCETLASRGGVAFNTGGTGDRRAALKLYRQLVADEERVLGPDHRETLLSRGNIAFNTGEAGDRLAALALYQQLATDCERILGPDDRATLANRAGVAYLTGEAGDRRAAHALHRQLATDSERVLGPDDLDTLISRHNLACATGGIGDHAAGLAIAEDVVRRAEGVCDPGDELLSEARSVRDRLRRQALVSPPGPVPRELREVRRLLKRKRPAQPPTDR